MWIMVNRPVLDALSKRGSSFGTNMKPLGNDTRCAIAAAAAVISSMFALLLTCVWGNAIWREFLRPSEPVWWIAPVELSAAATAFGAFTFLLLALMFVPFWASK